MNPFDAACVTLGQGTTPTCADWFAGSALYFFGTAVATAGAGLVAIYGARLVWPFITGWMAKYRKAGNGKAGG